MCWSSSFSFCLKTTAAQAETDTPDHGGKSDVASSPRSLRHVHVMPCHAMPERKVSDEWFHGSHTREINVPDNQPKHPLRLSLSPVLPVPSYSPPISHPLETNRSPLSYKSFVLQ